MKRNETSIINLEAHYSSINELKSFKTSEFSQFWIVNTIINSLYSINNNTNKKINEYCKGSVFEEIRIQLDIIVNNLELVRLNERNNTVKSLIWKELGNCVSVYIIELIEKWDAKICELQNNHLNNCEVTFDALVPDFIEFQNRASKTVISDNILKKDNLWDDDKLFWEIDSSYPFKEFKFGVKENTSENINESDALYSNHITILYLSNIMRSYLPIWKNIRLFLNNIVRMIFLSGNITAASIDHYKSELNIYIIDLLFRNVEKSLLLLDENMISIWLSLLRRCVDLFYNIIPKNTSANVLSLLNKDYNLNLIHNFNEYHEFVRIIHDISSNSLNKTINGNNGRIFKIECIGKVLGLDSRKNDIINSEHYISSIKNVNYNTDKPIDIIVDVDIKKKTAVYHPLATLYILKSNSNNLLRYTYNNIFGNSIKYKKNELKKYYKLLFIKNTSRKEHELQLIDDINGVRIIDLLNCIKDFIILEDAYTEHLLRALYIDSKKTHPNIDVDPTELNLSIKLLGKKDIMSSSSKNDCLKIKHDYDKIRKTLSMLLLEFDTGSSKEYIKDQLPTYYSLKIRLNIPTESGMNSCNNNEDNNNCINASNKASLVDLNTYGLPNYIISEFLDEEVMESYSAIFTFLLEVKRSTIFLNQVFQILMSIKKANNKLLFCKHEFKNNGIYCHLNSRDFCDNSCMSILNWIDNIYTRCYKIRYSIQFIIDVYNSCISMYMKTIWRELENSLDEKESLKSMVNSHSMYVNKLHKLTLAPNRMKDHRVDDIGIDEEFQIISINIVSILKLARNINIISHKFNQLVQFLINTNNTIKEKRYIPCGLIKRKIQSTYKRIIISLDLLFSNYNEYKNQLIDSIKKYSGNNNINNENLNFILMQLTNIIY
ncbi:hypothetical protein RS030_81430 [Cryptosporidium xiaoi]|uniref:Gamma tubulin complex component C-terminal domain-containing protein n=1 Tax=Cryptosporidium xiaoi TaxID=659607 RepID=A0AAV9XUE9_9CRYT